LYFLSKRITGAPLEVKRSYDQVLEGEKEDERGIGGDRVGGRQATE
jgi:hypothetical protein